jgi:WD40 repeat protein
VNAVEFSPDGKTVISGDSGGLIRFWRLETGDQLCDLELNLPGGACAGLEFHAISEMLLIRDGEGTLTALPLRLPVRR